MSQYFVIYDEIQKMHCEISTTENEKLKLLLKIANLRNKIDPNDEHKEYQVFLIQSLYDKAIKT